MKTQLWACPTCKVVGAVAWAKGEVQDEITSRLWEAHIRVTPDCSGNQWDLLTLPREGAVDDAEQVAQFEQFQLI